MECVPCVIYSRREIGGPFESLSFLLIHLHVFLRSLFVWMSMDFRQIFWIFYNCDYYLRGIL